MWNMRNIWKTPCIIFREKLKDVDFHILQADLITEENKKMTKRRRDEQEEHVSSNGRMSFSSASFSSASFPSSSSSLSSRTIIKNKPKKNIKTVLTMTSYTTIVIGIIILFTLLSSPSTATRTTTNKTYLSSLLFFVGASEVGRNEENNLNGGTQQHGRILEDGSVVNYSYNFRSYFRSYIYIIALDI